MRTILCKLIDATFFLPGSHNWWDYV